jgi:hypothetical protein
MGKLLFSLVLLLFASAASPRVNAAEGSEAESVPRFGTADIVLDSGREYDGGFGWTNPFTDVELSARVTSPSGRTFQVDGFFDGDGQGGQAGRLFKIRIAAQEEGWWSWTTSSNVPELDDRQGRFLCSGRLEGAFGAGPIIVDPDHPRYFRHSVGDPIYLIGKFLDEEAPEGIRYSHTLFSERLDDQTRQRMVDRHVAMKLNKMNVYVFNRGDYGGVSTTPWLTGWWFEYPDRFDLAHWHMYERWVATLRDSGMAAHIWMFADDSHVRDMPREDRSRLVAYAMARLSAYSNTLFTLALEWQEDWLPKEVEDQARFLQSRNPWKRLVSVHGQTGDVTFPDAPWADYMQLQAGNTSGPATVHDMGLRARARTEKPLIQEEHGRGKEDERNRRNAWAALMSGAAGSGTGASLRPLAEFVETIPFQLMAPAQERVLGGAAYALAAPGLIYVAYLADGGSVRLDLSDASGRFDVRWFNPKAGVFLPASQVGPDIEKERHWTFDAPETGDWVLEIRHDRRQDEEEEN